MKDKFIIIVDDERVISTIMRLQLKKHCPTFHIEVAESGEEALEVIEELVDEGKKLHAVITDWLMPGMKGDLLLSEVSKNYKCSKKIIVSGQADGEAIKRAFDDYGLDKFFPKPWPEDELITTINS